MLISRRPRHLLGPLRDSCLRLPPLGLRFHQSGHGWTASEGWMPTRSGRANLYTREMTPAEDGVALIDHITGARCVLQRRVRGLFSTIDRTGPSRDICRPRGHTCKNWLAGSNLQLLFNSAKGGSTTGIRRKRLSFSRFLVKKRDPEEAALMKASLCSKASAEHGTSSETSLRTRLAHHVWRRALLPAARPPTPTPPASQLSCSV